MSNPNLISNSKLFVPFDTAHIAVIATTLLVCFGVSILASFNFSKNRVWISKSLAKTLAILLGGGLVAQILSFNFYHLFVVKDFNLLYHLPFHLCTISAYLTVLALILNHPKLNTMQLYLAPVGAFVGMLFPSVVGMGQFPDFTFIEFFASHSLIIISSAFIFNFRRLEPNFGTFVNSCKTMIGFMGLAFVVNSFVGSNYFNLVYSPKGNVLMGITPDSTSYIITLTLTAFLVMLGQWYWVKKYLKNQVYTKKSTTQVSLQATEDEI